MPRTPAEMQSTAHERATRYAPRPKWNPVHAGIAGAAIVGFPLAAFLGLARLDPDDFSLPVAIVICAGFVAPYAYLKHQERAHYRAWFREYEALKAEGHE
ncbi:MAG: hypothetical protein K5821_05455 [Nitrobacter sp.]|uniref:hypothetical protein n=1 Tax=Nitrobacter sp. TaxID=29420 RepID=UPI00260BC321|nr:hypothetical protein [Nitrobacter sp.]MCV0385864.1 hypothetical protein [Nitrobacter sp.]